nr:kelch repeat-containing protein [uncultured Pedobacter sp.]
MRNIFLRFVLIFFVILFNCRYTFSQNYGLGFYGNDVNQDKRTGLDLSPNSALCFDQDFEISFEIGFIPRYKEYFGYILRLNHNNQTIDLLYDGRPSVKRHFLVSIGDVFSHISFNIAEDKLFENWNKITLRFDFKKKQLTLTNGQEFYTQNIGFLDKNSCFKFLFGANSYKNLSNTDVPHFKIKEIKINKNGYLAYHWPLNEIRGNYAKEEINGKTASVVNPQWIKRNYLEWDKVTVAKIHGAATVAYDRKNDRVLMIGSDSIFMYNFKTESFSNKAYKSGKYPLPKGNRSFFDQNQNKLYNFFNDKQSINTFDFKTYKWSDKIKDTAGITLYWHLNQFFSSNDSSLYIFGGYGQFTYKNQVKRYAFKTHSWDTLKVSGDVFTPRYLAALAPNKDKSGVYILGGYGSTTGQQVLNPKFLYDLVFFDIKKQHFKKLFSLNVKDEDFVFGNSMISEGDSVLYALTYPKHKFNAEIQLIKIGLKDSVWEKVGTRIPFLFHDTQSFAELFYDNTRNKFIAVTSFLDNNDETSFAIYTLNSPPLPAINGSVDFKLKPKWLIIIPFFIILSLAIFYFRRYRKKAIFKNKGETLKIKHEAEAVYVHNPNHPIIDIVSSENVLITNTIFLFGDLQLFDNEGNDITKYFTPLIKELFLAITLYTLRWGRGISSEKLNELIWFDKSVKSARNNRSVNIAKLKAILEKIQDCTISKQTGYWTIHFDNNIVRVDYLNYINIVKDKNKLTQEKVLQLISIIERGSFLPTAEYEWLDSFKSEISNEIIDIYNSYIKCIDLSSDPEFLIRLSDCIFYIDPVNEEAMIIKCKSLALLGKHSLAKKAFENFTREYSRIYSEAFNKDLNMILN